MACVIGLFGSTKNGKSRAKINKINNFITIMKWEYGRGLWPASQENLAMERLGTVAHAQAVC